MTINNFYEWREYVNSITSETRIRNCLKRCWRVFDDGVGEEQEGVGHTTHDKDLLAPFDTADFENAVVTEAEWISHVRNLGITCRRSLKHSVLVKQGVSPVVVYGLANYSDAELLAELSRRLRMAKKEEESL